MEKLFSKKPVTQSIEKRDSGLNKRPPQVSEQYQNEQKNQEKSKKFKKSQKHLQKQKTNQNSTEKIFENLKSSKFRLLNEYLYTKNSNESLNYFKDNPEEFNVVKISIISVPRRFHTPDKKMGTQANSNSRKIPGEEQKVI